METILEQALQTRLARLERRQRYLYLLAGLSLTIMLTGAVWQRAVSQTDSAAQVLRVRGLVIVDEQGRERILLGAPIPAAANRVRTSPERVKAIWGPRFPPEYLKWYQEYRHDTNGLLILDEQGFDRIALGAAVPDPNIGRRIGPSTGMIINDEQGFERSGYGLLKVQNRYRVVLGLDSAQGTEGLYLSLHDDGPTGLGVQDGQRSLFLGASPPGSAATGLTEAFFGQLLRQGREVRHQINIAPQK